MTGRHVSNPLAGLGTCPLMKIEEGKSLKNESKRRHIERNKERRKKKSEKGITKFLHTIKNLS